MDIPRKPSIWDWVCYKHNAHLMTMFGRAKCIADPECVRLDNDMVQIVGARTDVHYLNVNGHWLEHLLSMPGANEPSGDLECERDGMHRENATTWYHLYAAEEQDAELNLGGYLSQVGLVRSVALVGPVYAHAEQWVSPEGLTPRNGLVTRTFQGDGTLPYVRSFQHNPTLTEVRLAFAEAMYRHALQEHSTASNGSRTHHKLDQQSEAER